MRPVASDFDNGGPVASVAWMHMTPYATSGTFLSRTFDAGARAGWRDLSWTADLPAGTSVAMSVRAGDTSSPDGTWSAFQPVANPGDPIGANSVTSSTGRSSRRRTSDQLVAAGRHAAIRAGHPQRPGGGLRGHRPGLTEDRRHPVGDRRGATTRTGTRSDLRLPVDQRRLAINGATNPTLDLSVIGNGDKGDSDRGGGHRL